MHIATCRALNALNRAFYDARGADFDASRDHAWPGWPQALAALERLRREDGLGTERVDPAQPRRVLDLGCGNGRFGNWLMHRDATPTRYLGLDASTALLDSARTALHASPGHFDVELQQRDFLEDPGPEALPDGPFDLIAVFGVLHHVPSEALRRRLVAALADRLAPGGGLVLTAWQFGGKPRFERSLMSAEAVRERAPEWGFDPDDLEPGDHLLGFGGEASVPRYCHAIDEAALEGLTRDLVLKVVDTFFADGKSADLNAYRVLTKVCA